MKEIKYAFVLCVIWIAALLIAGYIDNDMQKITLQEQIAQQKEQIEALKEELAVLHSKMPVDGFKGTDNKLPSNEIKIEIEQDDKASRNADSRTPVLMRVTAYDLSYQSCKKYPNHPEYGITASGHKVQEWHTVAASPDIPFGTKIFIPYFADKINKGIFTVEDRGSAIKEGCLDIYMPNHDDCIEFGVKELEVYILGGNDI